MSAAAPPFFFLIVIGVVPASLFAGTAYAMWRRGDVVPGWLGWSSWIGLGWAVAWLATARHFHIVVDTQRDEWRFVFHSAARARAFAVANGWRPE